MPLKFRPKLDKIIELLLYLAERCPGADKYQAVKFFYLADREHLARYGRPITYDNYFALWYGPVASKALDLLEGDKWVMRAANVTKLPFKVTPGKAPNGSDTIFISDPEREVNLDLFSKSDIRTFDEVIDRYKNYSFKQLMDMTHDHAAYKEAWNKRRGGGDRAEMYYEEMIDDQTRRAALVEDLGPVSANM
ncbi:MAG TPA: Panacea domain-containing protein [Pseudolabrys sp.]